MWSRECLIVGAIFLFVAYPPLMYLFFTSEAFESWHCLGAPFLYVTFHGNLNGPVKYTRDGCSLTNGVLKGFKTAPENYFRSMAVTADNTVFIVEECGKEGKNSSGAKIMQYGPCDENGLRHFESLVLNEPPGNLHGANHPYGIAVGNGPNSTVYTSYQNTDVVLRYQATKSHGLYSPMPLPPALASHKKHSPPYYPGTFYQFGQPGYHKHREQGVRSIILVNGDLWIANEKTDEVVVVGPDGHAVEKLQVRAPIGMYYSSEHDMVFVSSRSSYGVVIGYSATTRQTIQRFHVDGMTHPTGVVSFEGTLYVLEQALGVLYAFNIGSGAFEKVVFSGLADKGLEQIALSFC